MISGLVTPPVYDYKDPNPFFVYGEPLSSFGLENHGVVNGTGLMTRGLVWQVYDLWFDTDYYSNLSSTWVAASGSSVATTWSEASGSSISTTWSNVQYGLYGPYSP